MGMRMEELTGLSSLISGQVWVKMLVGMVPMAEVGLLPVGMGRHLPGQDLV